MELTSISQKGSTGVYFNPLATHTQSQPLDQTYGIKLIANSTSSFHDRFKLEIITERRVIYFYQEHWIYNCDRIPLYHDVIFFAKFRRWRASFFCVAALIAQDRFRPNELLRVLTENIGIAVYHGVIFFAIFRRLRAPFLFLGRLLRTRQILSK